MSESGGVSALAVVNRADSHDSGVDGAADTVGKLHVDLWHLEILLVVCVVFLDVSLGRGVHHVSLLEALDGLVLGNHPTAVSASASVRVALVLLVSPVVSPL